jgi:hypothetical protein
MGSGRNGSAATAGNPKLDREKIKLATAALANIANVNLGGYDVA